MGEFSVMDTEFNNIKGRFDTEMKRMEWEIRTRKGYYHMIVWGTARRGHQGGVGIGLRKPFFRKEDIRRRKDPTDAQFVVMTDPVDGSSFLTNGEGQGLAWTVSKGIFILASLRNLSFTSPRGSR